MDTERDDAAVDTVAVDTTSDDADLELVEEISIDGMCGVY